MYFHPISQDLSFPPHLTGIMEVNTSAILHNYRILCAQAPQSLCGAVLKADAYGFGIDPLSTLLYKEGCRHFFVAHLEEGIELQSLLPPEAQIYVFSGLLPGTESLFSEHSLIPVLNDKEMVLEWGNEAKKRGKKLPAVLHFDTGMQRNGFDQENLVRLFETPEDLALLEIKVVMSHLVSSHNPKDPLNQKQREQFHALRLRFPKAKGSLADTGGIYLGAPFHYEILRPGKGLFGLYPHSTLRPCLRVLGRILQIRTAPQGETVGYGATHTLTRDSRLATLGIGFADGYPRSLSNKGHVLIGGREAPIIGRISMDYMVVDVTDIPEALYTKGDWAELITETLTLETLADKIGGISRELSTTLGKRFARLYV